MTDANAMTAGARRAITYLAVVTLLLAGTGLLLAAREVSSMRQAITASCRFNADLGGAPVVAPKGVKPSVLGVTIVSDARIAWRQLGCTGTMPAAAPSFLHWARYYHLPIS